MVDLLVLGATGYTGRLVTRYLAVHRERDSFTFGLAGRSKSKLDQLVSDLGLSGTRTFTVNVLDDASIEAMLSEAQPKVLLTTVGPFWTYGVPVAHACATHGINYVDITGEVHFVRKLINELDFIASKNHAALVTCCGLDSLPTDALAYLSARTMRSALESALGTQEIGNIGVEESHTLIDLKGGVSGGTLATIITMLETFSSKEISTFNEPDFISPIKVRKPQPRKLVYKLPATHPTQYGHATPLAPGDTCVVQRTRGLYQLNADALLSAAKENGDLLPAYGEDFTYSESMTASNQFTAFFLGLGITLGRACLETLPPLRWLVKRLAVSPGHGPSDEQLEKGYIKARNVSVSTPIPGSNKPIVVESTLKGRGDPGYALTAVMVTETALALLAERETLPPLTQRGGVLTPMSALGTTLIKRLSASGRFEFESSVREEGD